MARARHPHTITHVDVTAQLRGHAPRSLDVVQLGGRIADDWMPAADVARLEPGEDVVLFLIRQPGGEYVLAGMSQGEMHVDAGGNTVSWLPTAPLWDGTAVRDPVARTFTMPELVRALESR
jgi:hypothetical protein